MISRIDKTVTGMQLAIINNSYDCKNYQDGFLSLMNVQGDHSMSALIFTDDRLP